MLNINTTVYSYTKQQTNEVLKNLTGGYKLKKSKVSEPDDMAEYITRERSFTTRSVGINTFYNVPKKIAEFLNLPNAENCTGYCFGCSVEVVHRTQWRLGRKVTF